jgi:alpha-beta hydrolase superfamily lysophospholipase
MSRMETADHVKLDGTHGSLAVRVLSRTDPTHLAVISHGYGEHGGRYAHVAAALLANGATVITPDHHGHGLSDGERVHVADAAEYVADLHTVVGWARDRHPGVPVVLIGHSMGGLIATRYAQTHPEDLAVLVLSGPVVGLDPGFLALIGMDPMPEVPIDPAVLSRDPAVGAAYAADPLVWHGPFKRPTLVALAGGVEAIAAGPGFGGLPTLWLHGETDALVPLAVVRPTMERLRGEVFEEHVYPGAAHEIFNETNRDEVIGDMIAFINSRLPAAR